MSKRLFHGISEDYHPYALETGAPQTAEDVSVSLAKRFSNIEEAASEANIPERCIKKIKKAKGAVVAMIAAIAFFSHS